MAVTENAASIPDTEMIAKGRCMEKRGWGEAPESGWGGSMKIRDGLGRRWAALTVALAVAVDSQS